MVVGSSDQLTALAIQSDGKIVVAGQARMASNATFGSSNSFALVRFNTNGSRDTAFGTEGLVTTAFSTLDDFARGVALQKQR